MTDLPNIFIAMKRDNSQETINDGINHANSPAAPILSVPRTLADITNATKTKNKNKSLLTILAAQIFEELGDEEFSEPCLTYVCPSMVMVSLFMVLLLVLVNFSTLICVNQLQGRYMYKSRSTWT